MESVTRQTDRPLLTVQLLKDCFWRLAILVERSPMATGMSAGEGGASSTLAYLQKVFSLGTATSLAVASRAGAFLMRAAMADIRNKYYLKR